MKIAEKMPENGKKRSKIVGKALKNAKNTTVGTLYTSITEVSIVFGHNVRTLWTLCPKRLEQSGDAVNG